jgi:ABC-type multidrug transport system ATPase subunit
VSRQILPRHGTRGFDDADPAALVGANGLGDVDVSVQDNLAVFARLYRVKDVRAAVDRGLELARLTRRRTEEVDKLSGGMRRRLLLARGLVHRPRLILLDEPTVGLDPQIRTELWSLIDGLRSEGATILMSTHYIEEAQRLADEVAVMAHGKVVARGRPAELIAEHAGRETAEVYAPPDRLAEVRADAEARPSSGCVPRSRRSCPIRMRWPSASCRWPATSCATASGSSRAAGTSSPRPWTR